MTRSAKWGLLLLGLSLSATAPVGAQEGPPRATLLVGIGNAMGWIGGQVEAYLANGRLSGFAGLGYMPNLLNEEGSGAAGALGVRAFTTGPRHRGLVEVSFSALSTSVHTTFPQGTTEVDRGYGPSIAVGYQFIGAEGITFMLTGGVGFGEADFDPEASRTRPTLGLGIGFSWR